MAYKIVVDIDVTDRVDLADASEVLQEFIDSWLGEDCLAIEIVDEDTVTLND